MTRSHTKFARLRRIARRLWALVHVEVVDVVYVLDLADYRLGIGPGPNVEVRQMEPHDRAALAEAFGAAKANDLVERLNRCFGTVAFVNGKAAGYSWMTDAPRAGEGEAPFFYDVKPKAGWCYMFDTYVAPSARGLGLGTLLKRGLIAEAQYRGLLYCVATHEQNNASVIRVSENLGFKLAGTMTYRRTLGSVQRDLSGLPEGIRT